MADLLNESMNAPEGRLARVLVDLLQTIPSSTAFGTRSLHG